MDLTSGSDRVAAGEYHSKVWVGTHIESADLDDDPPLFVWTYNTGRSEVEEDGNEVPDKRKFKDFQQVARSVARNLGLTLIGRPSVEWGHDGIFFSWALEGSPKKSFDRVDFE